MSFILSQKSTKPLAILLSCLICFCLGNSWTIVPAISNYLIDNKYYTISRSFYAFLNALLVLSAAGISITAGFLGKKYRMKAILLAGICLCFVSLLFLYSGQFYQEGFKIFMVLSQVLLGLGIGVILTSLNVYLVLLIPNATAMILTGVYSCVNLGSFSCPLFINYIFGTPYWWSHVLFIAILFLLILPTSAVCLPDLSGHREVHHRRFINKNECSFDLIICILIMFLFSIMEISITSWSPLFLYSVKNLSLKFANLGLSVFWINVGAFHLLSCLLVKWIQPKFIFRTLPVFVICALFYSYFASGIYKSFLVMSLLGIGCSSFYSLCVNFAENRFKNIKEFMSGSMVTAYFLGSFIGAVFIGYFYQKNRISLEHIFLLMGFISITYFILILYEQKRKSN